MSRDALSSIIAPDRLAWMKEPDMAGLLAEPKTWLVTGCAGFIGSNLVEALLRAGQNVRGLDNFATGRQSNLDEVNQLVGQEAASRFDFLEGDIRDLDTCRARTDGTDYVLHQGALGSVPRSLANPIASHEANVNGTLNIFEASRENGVKHVVFAASSSTYGDHPDLPKKEDKIGNPLSPYAGTKLINEIYAAIYARNYGQKITGLRYFNVFGPRQNPNGAYAAVIPKWLAAMIAGETLKINGKGDTSRDFCYVDNAVQANIKAALLRQTDGFEVFNVAYGQRTSLLELFDILKSALETRQHIYDAPPEHGPYRPGDVRHALADISNAANAFGYDPNFSIRQGVEDAIGWYMNHLD